jgi:hypothetical protein
MTTTSSFSDAATSEPPVEPVALPDLSSAELQAHARETWVSTGGRLTGAELAHRYGRSERWGRQQIAAVRSQAADRGDTGSGIDSMAADGNGSGEAGVAVVDRTAPAPAPSGTTPASGAARPGADAAAAPRPSRRQRPTASAARMAARAAGRRQSAGKDPPVQAPLPLLVVTVAAVVVVTLVCAVVSYTHIRDLAQHAGMGSLALWLPLGVDGLVVAASCSLIVDRQLERPGHPLAWAGVALGLAGSLAANVLAVDPDLVPLRAVRWVLAGYGPAALAVSGHLLFRMLGDR